MEMSLNRIFDWLGLVVGLAIVTVIFTSPQTRHVLNAFAALVVGALRAATLQDQ